MILKKCKISLRMESHQRSNQYINPGPIVDELLKLQQVHRSQSIWENNNRVMNFKFFEILI